MDSVVEVSLAARPGALRARRARRPGRPLGVRVLGVSVYTDDATPGAGRGRGGPPGADRRRAADIEAYGPAKVACEEAVRCPPGVPRCPGGPGRSDRRVRRPQRPVRLLAGAGRPGHGSEPVLIPPLGLPGARSSTWRTWRPGWCAAPSSARAGSSTPWVTPLPLERGAGRLRDGRRAASPRWVEAEDAWLLEHEVEPWMGPESLPLWVPQPEYGGFMTRSNDAAQAAGLGTSAGRGHRPERAALGAGARAGRPRRAGLTPERERSLLSAREVALISPADLATCRHVALSTKRLVARRPAECRVQDADDPLEVRDRGELDGDLALRACRGRP